MNNNENEGTENNDGESDMETTIIRINNVGESRWNGATGVRNIALL